MDSIDLLMTSLKQSQLYYLDTLTVQAITTTVDDGLFANKKRPTSSRSFYYTIWKTSLTFVPAPSLVFTSSKSEKLSITVKPIPLCTEESPEV